MGRPGDGVGLADPAEFLDKVFAPRTLCQYSRPVACCRFRGHRDKVFNGTGEWECRRRKFSREFKLEAVRLVKDRGVAVAQAARDLDLHENVLRKWVREFVGRSAACLSRPWSDEAGAAGDRPAAQGSGQAEGGARHPKKGRSLLREGSDMRFAFIAKHRGIWPVAWLCECAGCLSLGLPCLAQPQPQRSRSAATRCW